MAHVSGQAVFATTIQHLRISKDAVLYGNDVALYVISLSAEKHNNTWTFSICYNGLSFNLSSVLYIYILYVVTHTHTHTHKKHTFNELGRGEMLKVVA